MNTQDNHTLYASFLADGETYIRNLNNLFLELEKDSEKTDLIQQAFRNAHSVKSEASYLEENEISEAAHEMESLLEEIIEGQASLDRERFDYLFYSVDKIGEMFNLRKTQKKVKAEEESAQPESEVSLRKTVRKDENVEQERGQGFTPLFSDFERELLKEARERGERFLRVTVRLEENTPISYAKGYLILNNLEQLLQVIRSAPPFGTSHERSSDEEKYRTLHFYSTGDVDDAQIYEAVNVDQVKRIIISPLSYESVIDERLGEPEWKRSISDISVKIDGKSIDRLNGYVDELKIRVHRLSRHETKDEKQTAVLTELVEGLEEFARNLSMVELSEILQPHHRTVRDLASKLEKKASLELEGCDIRIDRRAGEILSEITVHLIRNALDHGIEVPERRKELGKDETGEIRIHAEEEEGKLFLTVSDDGKGIDKEELRDEAQKHGIKTDEVKGEEELLRFLVYPGLTTHEDATETSGRGYGLDLVFQKIRQFEGGELRVHTDEGGTSFTVEMPSGFTLLTLQIVRCGSDLIAVPQQHIQEIVSPEGKDFSSDEAGALLWNSFPVYTLEGRLYHTDETPADSYGLLISYLNKRALVLVDELMFKKEIPEDRLILYIEGSPYLHKMKITGSDTEYYYLSPSIVTM